MQNQEDYDDEELKRLKAAIAANYEQSECYEKEIEKLKREVKKHGYDVAVDFPEPGDFQIYKL